MMVDKNSLSYFTDAVNRLIDEDLILVDKNIASVLRCVASTQILKDVLTDTLKNSSYVTEFSRARVSWTNADGKVECKLRLPTDKNRLFTFVVCFLTEVDSGRRNFVDFLREYYFENDSNDSYARFIDEVLKPFKRAGENILKSVDPDSLNADLQEQAQKYFNAEKIYIESSSQRQLIADVQKLRSLIEKTGANDSIAKDMQVACEGLCNALLLKNPKILNLSYFAVKYLFNNYDICRDIIKEIDDEMKFLK